MRALRALGRALLLGLVRLLFPPAGQAGPVDAARIRKLLVVRTDSRVGNVLLTTPLVRALRAGLPQARVDWLVAAGKEQLVAGLADRVLPFQKRDFFRAPWRFWGFALGLRRERYDAVVEAGHWHAFSFTSLWLARFTRAPVRVGHQRGPSERFLTHPVLKDPAIDREVPAKLELLRPFGLPACGEQVETTVDRAPAAHELAGRLAAQAGGRPLVALNPGARKADRRWPAQAFGALAARLAREAGAAPLVLWGPGEEPLARQVQQASLGAAALAPATDLAALAAVFRRCALVVTNDTGPMHLAAAAGAPVLALLVAPDGARWCHGGRFVGVAVRTGQGDEVERAFAAARRLLAAAAA